MQQVTLFIVIINYYRNMMFDERGLVGRVMIVI